MTDVAIVGLGAMFPGAGDAAAFWRNIRAGADAISDVPSDRWDPALYSEPERAGADYIYCRRGGFLGPEASFDPAPFGIMPSAVDDTEPDQLLMLRVAAAALAHGATLPERERVGVIVGRGGYATPRLAALERRVGTVHQLMAVLTDLVPGLDRDHLAAVRAAFEREIGPGPTSPIDVVPNFTASRLANRLDLRGPAYTVDAACASSLVAVDHAVRELATGRCDAVLAGGVHICQSPALWSAFTRLRALSPGGVIRPLAASADGTLLSEGAGVVLLKRLADARVAGDPVFAVIRGVGIASDGRATSLMSPLVEGQELAIRRAWLAAGLDPAADDALGLLEAHGSATPAGDQAELAALGRVFGPPRGRPAGIGSVKSMIGHAMPAAGIAGLIKAACSLHEGILPPTLHVTQPHPALASTRFEPVTQARPWDDDLPRRAGVSAFGFGGINAHVVLEAAAGPGPAKGRHRSRRPGRRARGAAEQNVAAQEPGRPEAERPAGPGERVLRLAAETPAALAALLAVPDPELLARGGDEPGDGPCRLAVAAPDARRLELARMVAGRGAPWRGRGDIWFTPRPLLSDPGQVAFLYPGFEPDFAPRAEGVPEALGLPAPRLRGAVPRGADGVLAHALDVIATGRLFTAALGELGITPGVLAGHSLGEWTALVVAGVLPDADQFLESLRPALAEPDDAFYLALGTGADRAAALIEGLDGVVLTHDNCTRQTVACGPAGAIATAAARAGEAGVLARELPFRTGFHSPVLVPYLPAMRGMLGDVPLREPRLPVWSATSLAPYPASQEPLRDLVLRHMIEPVRFRQLTRALHDAGIRAFVQAGPGSLTGFIADTLEGHDHVTVAAAAAKRDGLAQLQRAAAALWTEGLSPRFDRLTRSAPGPAAGPAAVSAAVSAAVPAARGAGSRVAATGAAGAAVPTALCVASVAGGGSELGAPKGTSVAGVTDAGDVAAAAGVASAGVSPAGVPAVPAVPAGSAGSAATGGKPAILSAGAAPSSGTAVRLKLAGPQVVRLAGKVAPIALGGTGRRPTASPGSSPALAELDALLAETAQAAESVLAVMAASPYPASSSPASSSPASSSPASSSPASSSPASSSPAAT
ncbi:MAG TPA: beta-ketoacyl synthase N-terminal-like domain-containing protein, partial [Trebonia sp.]|nr:beta-ketoacyl synthase N-terminal-like domain-containing protein [Trebonia sp.]